MSSSETAYRYEIPVEKKDNGSVTSSYNPTTTGEELYVAYEPNSYVIVVTEKIPHLHKENVEVVFNEVEKSEYK